MVGKVLITVKSSFEYGVRQDIRDYLFLHDRDVNVESTEFRGVLIVETSSDPIYVAKLLINAPIPEDVLSSVVPIIYEWNCQTLNDLVRLVRDHVDLSCKSYIVRCRLRGSPIGDGECEDSVINLLRSLGLRAVYRGNTDCAFVIEGLGSWCGMYVGPRSFVRV